MAKFSEAREFVDSNFFQLHREILSVLSLKTEEIPQPLRGQGYTTTLAAIQKKFNKQDEKQAAKQEITEEKLEKERRVLRYSQQIEVTGEIVEYQTENDNLFQNQKMFIAQFDPDFYEECFGEV